MVTNVFLFGGNVVSIYTIHFDYTKANGEIKMKS